MRNSMFFQLFFSYKFIHNSCLYVKLAGPSYSVPYVIDYMYIKGLSIIDNHIYNNWLHMGRLGYNLCDLELYFILKG